ncbi:uncharacterized protein SPSC_06106 [Sporisorium scitamineum]|uniref:Uncharacterized protein n=1 Tax=Sporisorium scitamineum TaxID=49012 RepID=A0A127ZIN6_9BASI|nr:uncharacterized protein SPSC_06106 [Sporisorium scitamineum]
MRAALHLFYRLFTLLLTVVLSVSALGPVDSMYYKKALEKYENAHTEYSMVRVANFDPDPERKWREGAMKERWLVRARAEGAMYVGRSPITGATYFSTIVRQNNPEDQLARDMKLQRSVGAVGGMFEWEAAIFWKRAGGTTTPLRIDYIRAQNARYSLRDLADIIGTTSSQVRPI